MTLSKRLPDLPPSAMARSPPPAERPMSPPMSQGNGATREAAASVKHPVAAAKRTFLHKFKKGHRQKDDVDASLKHLPASTRSLQDPPVKNGKIVKVNSAVLSSRKRDGSISSLDGGYSGRIYDYQILDPVEARKDASGRTHSGHGKSKVLRRHDTGGSRDLSGTAIDPAAESSLFALDTDLNDMEGIVRQPPPMTPPDGGIFTGPATGEEAGKTSEELNGLPPNAAEWNAPESWAVNRAGEENLLRLREIDEAGLPPTDADDGAPYCVRIFRTDSTFATLSTNLHSTVDELLRQLGRKSFLQDDLKNYQIVMHKHDLQRILKPTERPIAIQKRLLEQAGYTESDRVDEIGREDNSYLCRFTFVPAWLSGVYSLVCAPVTLSPPTLIHSWFTSYA